MEGDRSKLCFDETTADSFDAECLTLEDKLRHQKIPTSSEIAKRVAVFLKDLIYNSQGNDIEKLIYTIRHYGRRLQDCDPCEYVIANITMRVLYLVRVEYLSSVHGSEREIQYFAPSLDTLIRNAGNVEIRFDKPVYSIKQALLATVANLVQEIEDTPDDIAALAADHIHANEVIMVHGFSAIVTAFLITAKETVPNFEVVVVERAPYYDGHLTARRLAEAGISVSVVSDAAVLACMPRTDAVLIEPHAVLGDGGLVTRAGGAAMVFAARQHNVPLLVTVGMYKLSPMFTHQTPLKEQGSAASVIDPSDDSFFGAAEVYNPVFDYVPAKDVAVMVTNDGQHPPTYIYRLLTEYYHHADMGM